ncbi:hypothetical protein GGI07_003273 [Coemansia sp. Benny D115]|nr:hypothetical protein GGI07_003273 [Coemansia sp. Benny D115]
MQALLRLILEGLAMFAGSWAAGCVPLYVRMDQSKFNLLALFGAGLLIGAALAVILPEGVETLSRSLLSKRSAKESTDELVESMNNTIGWSMVAGFCVMFLIDNLFPSAHSHQEKPYNVENDSAACLDDIHMTDRVAVGGRMGNSEFTLHDPQGPQGHADDSVSSLSINNDHVDHQRRDDWAETSHEQRRPLWIRIITKTCRALSPRALPSTLIGILVHSCADGLALGAAVASSVAAAAAASSSSQPSAVKENKDSGEHTSSLELVVFMALLLHKAPAAFGLITTLKQQGFAPYKLGIWLTVFAASAPLAALATFSVFTLVGNKHRGADAGVEPWAGTVMLFSAGTFMYVAMAHTLAEAVHQAKELRAKAKSMISGKPVVGSLSILDITVLLVGVILPPLVSKDHDE